MELAFQYRGESVNFHLFVLIALLIAMKGSSKDFQRAQNLVPLNIIMTSFFDADYILQSHLLYLL